MKEIHHLARVKIPHFRDRLERIFARVSRPVMSGEISLEVGCSLAQVAREMEICALQALTHRSNQTCSESMEWSLA